jgi:hypothetical protein
VLLRTAGNVAQAIPQVLKTASEIDPKLASLGLAHSLDDALWAQRLPSTIATLFATIVGSLALTLASVGIYGTIAYAVAQRTREIGIRIALGAQGPAIVRLVLSRAMALAGAGACAGTRGRSGGVTCHHRDPLWISVCALVRHESARSRVFCRSCNLSRVGRPGRGVPPSSEGNESCPHGCAAL